MRKSAPGGCSSRLGRAKLDAGRLIGSWTSEAGWVVVVVLGRRRSL